MRAYKETSSLYEGMERTFIFIEGDGNRTLNRFVERYSKEIKEFIAFKGTNVNKFNIIKPCGEGERSARSLILRKCPTLTENELQEKQERLLRKSRKSKLLFISHTTPTGDGRYEAHILCEEDWEEKRGYLQQLLLFAEAVIETTEEQRKYNVLHSSGDRYKMPEEDEQYRERHEENCEWLCNDLLADSICNDTDETVSPIHFDEEFNISLPKYPQITIKIDPLPKSLYILLLIHPEGILLKEIQNYEKELRNIYSVVSGRKNPTVINRMLSSLVDPTDNPLHKNMSIIRRSFMSQLSYEIAKNYIPAHSRNAVHNIPLDNSLIEIPCGIFETCC